MSRWIFTKCMDSTKEVNDDWKHISHFLQYQGIPLYRFVGAMQRFLKCEPKKCCLVFHGPPNTGKSLFAMSLLSFLGGKVISFAISNSQFWLSPLVDAKVGLLDDATYKAWQHIDTFLRGGLDGNTVCIDSKHKAPVQMKFPPMLVTTNVDVKQEQGLKYLHSRLTCFGFSAPLPVSAAGEPRYTLNERTWASFFSRFWGTLALSDQEEEDDGPAVPLRLHTRSDSSAVRE